MPDHNTLDRTEILQQLFSPRQEARTASITGSYDIDCKVDNEITLGCRFHSSAKDAPVIIYFTGNNETVADYDTIAKKYTQFGMNILITSYRGYGWSGGTPTVTAMLRDAETLYQSSLDWLKEQNYTGNLFVMGRSLGCVSAIDLTEKHQGTIKGLIIESGFADTLPLLHALGVSIEKSAIREEDGFGNADKIAEVEIATLILHGSLDEIIPLQLAEKLQACCGARAKQFLTIPGAGHNTMITTGGDRYFETIKNFIDKTSGVTKWGYKRRKYKRPIPKA